MKGLAVTQPQAPTVKLNTVDQGAGLPVVLIHGFPLDHTIWQAQIEALSPDYRVIAPDLRGHGDSPASDGVYSMDLLARDVLALLDDLGVERAVWVGHSMGGYATMAALRLAPERILGVALVNTHPFADSDARRLERIQSAELVMENGASDLAFSLMSTLFGPHYDRQSRQAQAIKDLMAATPPEGVNGALRGMAERPDSSDTLRALRVPALVIAGADDPGVTPAIAEQTAQMIPDAELVIIPNAGHLAPVEQPEQTTAALREFLGRVK